MKMGKKLSIGYQKFGKEKVSCRVIEPYAVKVFKQRWYLLAHEDKWELPAIYALDRTPEYTDFEYYLRPTFDFRQELLCQGDEVEVLEPKEFREEMKNMIKRMGNKYKD